MADSTSSRWPAAAAGGIAAAFVGGAAAGVAIARHRRPSGAKQALTGARKAGEALQRLAEIQSEVHAVREQMEHSNRRSPIEIVLSGLTHRPGEPR
ncbi:MAG TPA: hypothetical protein VNO82_21985 [Solirubrobacteraceae bacterium]|nr:hypothetical protein [Solirubrobacteraceae bacterium]